MGLSPVYGPDYILLFCKSVGKRDFVKDHISISIKLNPAPRLI